MKLKTLIRLNEWQGNGSLTSNDIALRPMPTRQNDNNPAWEMDEDSSIIEDKDFFCHIHGAQHQKCEASATVYLNEENQPAHKISIQIKTRGLNKNKKESNGSHYQKIREHTKKVAKSWIKKAKDIYNGQSLSENGNKLSISWQTAFTEALNDPLIKSQIQISDPVNFTPRSSN